MAMSSFDDLSIAYDNSIDWDARLKREVPFLLQQIPHKGPARILDLACGSGRHAIALAENLHTVTGFDKSQSMIDTAKKLAREKDVSIDFFKADMLDFSETIDSGFTLAICLGNSLALLPSFDNVTQVIEQVYSILDTDGFFIFQVLNFHKILESGFNFFPMKAGRTGTGQDVVFSRFFDHSFADDRSLLVLTSYVKNATGWSAQVRQQEVLHLNYEWLTTTLTDAGFPHFGLFGDYSGTPFTPDSHRSLIVKVWK
jgi:SAM-dependent methyltransferase